MLQRDMQYYLIPAVDPHRDECVPEHWQRRQWISGFSGSAGDVLIGLDRAYLWTDSRYTLQATAHLDADLFEVHTILQGDSSVAITQWLAEQAALKIFGSQQAC